MYMNTGKTRTKRAQQLKRLFEAAKRDRKPQKFFEDFQESLKEGMQPEDFSIRSLFESFVDGGREMVDSWNPTNQAESQSFALLEASGAVDTSAFSNISGQIVYSKILAGFNSEAFVFSEIVETIPTQFDGEKIPGMSHMGDKAEEIGEGQEYPLVGFGEDYIETPVTTKRGMIVPITKEAIFFDRTGMILRRAGEVGEYLGLNKEKRVIDVVIDENSTAGRYKWKGTSYATYQTSTPWDNVTASAALTDWTDIDEAEQTLSLITDPYTTEPVMHSPPTHIIVTRQNLYKAKRIISATEIRGGTAANTNVGFAETTISSNPVANYSILTSQLLAARMGTDTTWYLGNPHKAFAYMENWPLTVIQAPTNSHDEFHRDIIQQFKASERGATTTLEPRVMTKCTA